MEKKRNLNNIKKYYNKSLLLITVINIIFLIHIYSAEYSIGYSSTLENIEIYKLFCVISISYVFTYNLFLNNMKYSLNSILSICSLLITYLLLPEIKGFFLITKIGDDMLHHLGLTKYILVNGFYKTYDPYPSPHILFTTIQLIGPKILKYPSSMTSFIYFYYCLMLILITKISNKKIFYSISFSIIPIYSVLHKTIHPNFLSLPYLSLTYFLNIKIIKQNYKSIIPLLIVTILSLYTHPISFIMIIIINIGFTTYYILNNKKNTITKLISIFSIIIFLSWIFYNRDYYIWFSSIFRSILYSETKSISEINIQGASNKNISQIFWYYLYNYSQYTFLIVTTVFVFIIVIFKNDKIKDYAYQQIIISSITFFIFFFISNTLSSIHRLFYPIQLSISPHIDKLYNRKLKSIKIILICFFIFTLFFSLNNIYPPPKSSIPNKQITKMTINGWNWIYKYKYTNISIITKGYDIFRLDEYFNTKYPIGIKDLEQKIPEKYGYYNNSISINNYYDFEFYMITNKQLRLDYLIYNNIGNKNYNPYDYNKYKCIFNDANNIYQNKEWEMWLVY